MKLWLDDVRPAPVGWVRAKTVDDAIVHMLANEVVQEASLDHDLGLVNDGTAYHPLAATGYDFCLWMAEYDIWPTDSIRVHSANGVGARSMCGVVDRYGPYDKPCRWAPEWN